MVGGLTVIAAVGSAFWVYFDATSHKIGKIPGDSGTFNMSAGGWAAVTLGLWIVGFPSYVLKRSSLLKRAKEHPVEPTSRVIGYLVLALVGIPWIAFAMAGAVARSVSH